MKHIVADNVDADNWPGHYSTCKELSHSEKNDALARDKIYPCEECSEQGTKKLGEPVTVYHWMDWG